MEGQRFRPIDDKLGFALPGARPRLGFHDDFHGRKHAGISKGGRRRGRTDHRHLPSSSIPLFQVDNLPRYNFSSVVGSFVPRKTSLADR